MPRIRTIKPEFCVSVQVAECSRDARLLFVLMWMFCDDAGRHKASVRKLKMECLPGDAVGDAEVTQWIGELIDNDLIDEYEVDGEAYWQVLGWDHQKIDHPNVKHPGPDGKTEVFSRRLGGKQRQLLKQKLIDRDGETCVFCGSKDNLAIDHIVPRSRGGSNDLDNLQLLCRPCNNEKFTKVTRGVRGGDAPPEGNGREGKGEERKGMEVVCAELETSPAPDDEPTGYQFSICSGRAWTLNHQKLVEYRETFPELDLDRELRLAAQWLRDNPKRRKTARGMPAFIGSWLGRAQNSGRAANGTSGLTWAQQREANTLAAGDEFVRAIREKSQ